MPGQDLSAIELKDAPASHWTKPGLAMYDLQPYLRPLPLPLLPETLARYLSSCKPLLSPAELANTQRLVAAFADGLGPELQCKLELRARECALKGSHWLSAWWEHFAYLACRAPLPIKWNVFGTLFGGTAHPDRLLRAARLLCSVGEFHLHLRSNRLAPDVLDTRGQIPLCMKQFERLFGSSRVPGRGVDALVKQPPHSEHLSYVVVFCDGHAYALRLLTAPPAADAEPRLAPVPAVALALAQIDAHASARGANASPLAALTTLQRDEWAMHRLATREALPRNAAALDRIEGALIALTLERSAPASPRELCHASHEGGDARSLWFDKPVSLIAFSNGRFGVNAEHAHFDAPVPARLFAYCNRKIAKDEARGATAPPSSQASEWRPLDFELPSTVVDAIEAAPAALAPLRTSNRLVPIRFEGGGRVKALAVRPISSDSVVQMALQLAQLRDQGELVATYESATTRRFALGRTETIRSCSLAATAFARAMEDRSATRAERLAALGHALKEHGEWLIACGSGRGKHPSRSCPSLVDEYSQCDLHC